MGIWDGKYGWKLLAMAMISGCIGGCASHPAASTRPVGVLQQTKPPNGEQAKVNPSAGISASSSRAPWTMHFIVKANQPLQNLIVPRGKVLVIEYISARYLHESAAAFPAVNYQLSIDECNYYFPVGGQTSAFMEFTGPVHIYALPGASIQSLLQYPEGNLEVSLSGYIVSLADF